MNLFFYDFLLARIRYGIFRKKIITRRKKGPKIANKIAVSRKSPNPYLPPLHTPLFDSTNISQKHSSNPHRAQIQVPQRNPPQGPNSGHNPRNVPLSIMNLFFYDFLLARIRYGIFRKKTITRRKKGPKIANKIAVSRKSPNPYLPPLHTFLFDSTNIKHSSNPHIGHRYRSPSATPHRAPIVATTRATFRSLL